MTAPGAQAGQRRVEQVGEDEPQLSDREIAALDLLADVLVHRMARTPEGIARTVTEVMHAPVEELRTALACVDAHLQRRCA